MQLSELQTPCLVLDQGRLDANIDRMNARMRRHGTVLRPHVKTAKSVDIAHRIFGAKSGPITVSTLAEAEHFFAAGFDDILYAVSVVPGRIDRIAKLVSAGCDLKVILDSESAATAIAGAASQHGISLKVLIEIDCDGHRAGLRPHDPAIGPLARLLNDQAGAVFYGFMTHAGASYFCKTTKEIRALAATEVKAIVDSARQVEQLGIDAPIRSVGSSPTATMAQSFDGISEVRAGVYVFQDLYQVGLGVCQLDDIALSVLTTVISHKPEHNRLIVDAGGLALSKDRGTANQTLDRGYGLVCRPQDMQIIDGLVVASVDQEHGLISSKQTLNFQQFPIGSKLRILPNHACMTAAAYDCYYLISDAYGAGKNWPRCGGW